jgi:hypothetical protein
MCSAQLATAEPNYSAYVSDYVMIPDVVETDTLGTLEFFDGMPLPGTVQKVYDNLDLVRATTAYLDGIPISSVYSILHGLREAGIEPGEVGISETVLGVPSLMPTPNTPTINILSQIDLSDGPMVVDAPPSMLGLVCDTGFRLVTDIGQAGPDKGKDGKYIFLPPGYEGEVPEGYHVSKSAVFDNLVVLRAAVKDGDTETPIKLVKKHLNIYPLALADNQPPEIFHNISGKQFKAIQANDYHFFEELNSVIQKEPADAFPPELTRTFASIGIKKGQPFDPDERMKRILTEAATIGNTTARAIAFDPGRDTAVTYEDRKWMLPLTGDRYAWMGIKESVKET